MDTLDSEIVQLWKALTDNKVRYITTGDFAVAFHGGEYHSGVLDLWIDDTSENREHLANAFTEMFEGDYSSFQTMDFVAGWTSFRLMSGFDVNIMTYVKGLEKEGFDRCLGQAPVADILGVPVRFLGYHHLIANKQAEGRPKDMINIDELRRANESK